MIIEDILNMNFLKKYKIYAKSFYYVFVGLRRVIFLDRYWP